MNRVCKLCKKKITEQTYGVFRGKAYHLEEFTCTICKKYLDMQDTFEDEASGCLYCGDCHHEHLAQKCESCSATIVGTAIEALGKTYHPHHFTCYKCKKVLEGNYFRSDDQPVCKECFETRKKGRNTG